MMRILFLYVFLVSFIPLSAQEVDSIIDIRDGRVYQTIKIGEQWWLQENLNTGNKIDSTLEESDNGIIEKYYFRDNDSLGDIYGGLYTFYEASNYAPFYENDTSLIQGICPIGWHIPSKNDWDSLVAFLGGRPIAGGKMKEESTIHWNSPNKGATNESGFTGIPGGALYSEDLEGPKFYAGLGVFGAFWTSERYDELVTDIFELETEGSSTFSDGISSGWGISIRPVFDSPQFKFLTFSDTNLSTISKVEFKDGSDRETIIIINSSLVNTITITSIRTRSTTYEVNKSQAVLTPGDSIQVDVSFLKPKNELHQDSLIIESNDPYAAIQSIPIGNIPWIDPMKDTRDGNVYNVVKIGKQWWMKENLDYGIKLNSIDTAKDNGIVEKFYYQNSDSIGSIYGGLYSWYEMMNYESIDEIEYKINRGICPLGWHIPSFSDWNELLDFLGGDSIAGGLMKEKGTKHWRIPNEGATNTSGFTALAGGYRWPDGKTDELGEDGGFWAADRYNLNSFTYLWLTYRNSDAGYSYEDNIQDYGLSVRCLRDYPQFSHLVISDHKFNSITKLEFTFDQIIDTIFITNSNANQIINISSVYVNTSDYQIDKSSATLAPGEILSLRITFFPPHYRHSHDSITILSDDPISPKVKIPLSFVPDDDAIIDIRDKSVYQIVRIGEQWWIKRNLNFGVRIDSTQSAYNNGIIEKYCYRDNDSLCSIYGGLYTWDEMMGYSQENEIPELNQGICPVSWHLPKDNEWIDLANFLGGEDIAGGKLKESGTIHWASPNAGATNETRFTALPSGGSHIGYPYDNLGNRSYIWSSTLNGNGSTRCRMSDYNETYLYNGNSSKSAGHSVRCLNYKDEIRLLTASDLEFKPVHKLDFISGQSKKEILIINSSAKYTINISSISTNGGGFKLNRSSADLMPGDSIHLEVIFNPHTKNIYRDTILILSDDPYGPNITIPLFGTFPPEITFTEVKNVSCNGFSDGSITATPILGTPPYTIKWFNSEDYKYATLNDLEANQYYSVTVTDDVGRVVTDQMFLSEPDSLSIKAEQSDTICPNTDLGFIMCNPEGGTSPYSFVWSTGETTQSLPNLGTGEYRVTVTDNLGCVDSAVFSIFPTAPPFGEENICIVTIDLFTGLNLIVWEKTPDKGIEYYNVYRENNLIGTVHFDDLSIYKDTIADPETRPFLYYISVIDTCGNESDKSPYHKPLFLQHVSSVDGVNLRWSHYAIENGDVTFMDYSIYRGGDSVNMAPLVEQIPLAIDVYTDNDPTALANKYFYRVAGILDDPCSPSGSKKAGTGPYVHSLSNMDDNKLREPGDTTGMFFYPLTSKDLLIYPNPVMDRFTIQFANPGFDSYQLILTDLTGKVLRIMGNITEDKVQINRDGLPSGLYLIELRGPRIYRGKILIE